MSGVIELADGVDALVNSLRVDDRTSWLRPGVAEFSQMNTYVIRGEPGALVIDPGITVHGESVVAQLSSVVARDVDLALLFSRLGEFNCASNGAAVMEAFNVRSVWGAYPADNFLDFLPGTAPAPASPSDWHGASVEIHELGSSEYIAVGGEREVLVFSSPLRLIATHWAYDRTSRILFCSDSFSHVYQPTTAKSWVVEAGDDDGTSEDQVRDHLMVKFGWLRSAQIDDIRRDVATIFERLEVDTIAPSYGCILRGRAVVERHYQMMQSALLSLGLPEGGKTK